MLIMPKHSTIDKILAQYPPEAKVEWDKDIKYQSNERKIYFLGSYKKVTPAYCAIALNISLNQAKNAIAILQAQQCLFEQAGGYISILAVPVKVQNPILNYELLAEQQWKTRPVYTPLRTKLKNLPEIKRVMVGVKK